MIRYTNDAGLRDYRIEVDTAPRRGWIWLVLLVGAIVLLDVAIAHWMGLASR